MEHDAETKAELIAELHASIQSASRDYFIWSRGRVIYEAGVEALIQVYSAKRLFDLFASQYDIELHLERKFDDLVGRSGAELVGKHADLILSFRPGPTYVVEFKRYTNESNLRGDIERLKAVVRLNPSCVGLCAAPCYAKEHEVDWPKNAAQKMEQRDPLLTCHVSEPRPLPHRFRLSEGWQSDRALVIEVRAGAEGHS